jgi:hypothetical protein
MSGWDGDALAGQMEDAQERAEQAAEDRKRLRDVRADDRKRSERMESLRLSHVRAAEQLSRATNPAHRAMLERAIQSLESEIRQV